jgi:hypothetical protein
MDMVRREVQKDPGVKSGELYEQAKKLDRSISSLSLRQFHARYPLQVKRALKSGGTRRTRKKATKRGRPANGRRKAGLKRTTARKKTTRKRATTKRGPGRPRKQTTGTPAKRGRPPGRKTTRRAVAAASGERGTVRAVLLEFAGEVASAENKSDMISVVAGMDRWVDRVMRASS